MEDSHRRFVFYDLIANFCRHCQLRCKDIPIGRRYMYIVYIHIYIKMLRRSYWSLQDHVHIPFRMRNLFCSFFSPLSVLFLFSFKMWIIFADTCKRFLVLWGLMSFFSSSFIFHHLFLLFNFHNHSSTSFLNFVDQSDFRLLTFIKFSPNLSLIYQICLRESSRIWTFEFVNSYKCFSDAHRLFLVEELNTSFIEFIKGCFHMLNDTIGVLLWRIQNGTEISRN